VKDTLIWRRETHTISEIEFPAIAAPRNLWLSTWRFPVDLALKAKSLLQNENTSKNKEDAI
jgi:hypothetical protein